MYSVQGISKNGLAVGSTPDSASTYFNESLPADLRKAQASVNTEGDIMTELANQNNQSRPATAKEETTIEKQDTEAQSPAAGGGGVPTDNDVPPNGGYGWICVICAALINGHTWGVNSSYGVFLSYYLANDVFPGATSFDYAMIGGIGVGSALIVSPAATYSIGRWGTKATLLIGVFFETLSLIAASFAWATWHLFLTQGLCFGIGMGFLFVGSVGIVPQWFTTKRSLANGCAAGGSGIGGLVYSLATGAMIPKIGLPWTFRVLGLVSFAVNFTCAIVIKDRNKLVGTRQVAWDFSLFKRWEYLLMEAWAFFSIIAYVILLFSLPSYVVSVGLDQQQAAVVGALFNLGQGVGRPVVGVFSDKGGRINLAAILTAFCGLLCLVVWIFAKSYGVMIFFALVAGTVAGTFWTTVAPVAAEVVGLKDLPSGLSMTWLIISLPAIFSEAIGLEINSASTTSNNPFLYAQIFTGLMYLLAAGSAWLLRAWKIGRLEEEAATLAASEIDSTDGTPAHKNGRAKSSLLHRLFVPKCV